MGRYDSTPIAKSDRIKRLVDHLYAKMPEIEASRAELITESYKATEGQPVGSCILSYIKASSDCHQTRGTDCRKHDNCA